MSAKAKKKLKEQEELKQKLAEQAEEMRQREEEARLRREEEERIRREEEVSGWCTLSGCSNHGMIRRRQRRSV